MKKISISTDEARYTRSAALASRWPAAPARRRGTCRADSSGSRTRSARSACDRTLGDLALEPLEVGHGDRLAVDALRPPRRLALRPSRIRVMGVGVELRVRAAIARIHGDRCDPAASPREGGHAPCDLDAVDRGVQLRVRGVEQLSDVRLGASSAAGRPSCSARSRSSTAAPTGIAAQPRARSWRTTRPRTAPSCGPARRSPTQACRTGSRPDRSRGDEGRGGRRSTHASHTRGRADRGDRGACPGDAVPPDREADDVDAELRQLVQPRRERSGAVCEPGIVGDAERDVSCRAPSPRPGGREDEARTCGHDDGERRYGSSPHLSRRRRTSAAASPHAKSTASNAPRPITSVGNARSSASAGGVSPASRRGAAFSSTARLAAISARRDVVGGGRVRPKILGQRVDRSLVALGRVAGVERACRPVVEDRLGARRPGCVGNPRSAKRHDRGARKRYNDDRATAHPVCARFAPHCP